MAPMHAGVMGQIQYPYVALDCGIHACGGDGIEHLDVRGIHARGDDGSIFVLKYGNDGGGIHGS